VTEDLGVLSVQVTAFPLTIGEFAPTQTFAVLPSEPWRSTRYEIGAPELILTVDQLSATDGGVRVGTGTGATLDVNAAPVNRVTATLLSAENNAADVEVALRSVITPRVRPSLFINQYQVIALH